MARPKVDKRLQNLEQDISEIKEILCSIKPCSEDDVAEEKN